MDIIILKACLNVKFYIFVTRNRKKMELEGKEGAEGAPVNVQSSLSETLGDLGLPKDMISEAKELDAERVKPAVSEGGAPKNDLEKNLGTPTEVSTEPPVEKKEVESPLGGEEKSPEGVKSEEYVIKNPLVGEQNIGKAIESPGSEGQKFENIEKLSSHLKEAYGIEDVSALGSEIDRLRSQEVSYNDLSGKYANVENLFKSMPKELHGAIELFTQGLDWKSSLQSGAIDFSSPLGDISKKDLVSAMMPGKITEDDWAEYQNKEDGDPAVRRLVESAIETSESLYGNKKKAFETAAANRIKTAQESQEAFISSVEASRNHLKSAFGNADVKVIDDIQSMSTPQGVVDFFFNNDGSLKEDSMYRLALATHGEGLIEEYKGIAERKAETRVNQELLARTPDSPSASKGSAATGSKEEIRPEVQEMIDGLKGEGSTFY